MVCFIVHTMFQIESTGFIKVQRSKDDEFMGDEFSELLNEHLLTNICNVLISYIPIA